MKTVSDVMTRSVVSVLTGTSLKEVARLLVDHRISGVPVVDDDLNVVGVVSETDFLIKEQGADAISHRPLARILGESRESQAQLAKLGAVTAGEAMSAPAITSGPERGIREAAALMIASGVNRLPVVADRRLVGMVTRADLIRAYLRSDEELTQTIRKEVLERALALDTANVTLRVSDGVVSIGGTVEHRSVAEVLEPNIRMVPGVLDVHDDVTWVVDDGSGASEEIALPPFI